MSRIARDRIVPGDTLTSTDLNTRYNDYVQPAAIDESNIGDGAIDLPQIPSTMLVVNHVHSSINAQNIYHSSPANVQMTLVAPATPVEVGRVDLTADPWVLQSSAPRSFVRVYASLQCKGFIEDDPNNTTTTANNLSLGAHVWIVQLEWDITSAALGAWEPMPGGGSFQTGAGLGPGRRGEPVSNIAGCGLTPAYWSGAENWVPGGRASGGANTVFRGTGWKNVAVTWSGFPPGVGTSVYGLRLVVHGVYHPHSNAGINSLALDTNFASWGLARANPPEFNYDSGSISAIHMREK
jgi:hypothetical protein